MDVSTNNYLLVMAGSRHPRDMNKIHSSSETTFYANALRAYADRETTRFNVPGHNADVAAAPELASYFGEDILLLDVPPLLATIDKGPDNPLELSQQQAAKAWGARRTWFLTNGASQANRIAALALAQFRRQSNPVVAQRSAHSSFFDGILLGGITPVFVMPTIDSLHGINHGVTEANFRQVLCENPDAKGAYVISPSYFGAVADVKKLSAAAHESDIPLIVDGAWGSHFGFHEDLPENPVKLGADIVISSTHKLGGSLTQSAMIHLAEGPYADELEPLINRAFSLTQSTSASSLLLASLDIARAALEHGHDRIGRSIRSANAFREALRQHSALDVVSDHFGQFPDIIGNDPLHISIDIRGMGLSGSEVRELLMKQFSIYTEIATQSCIVAILGPGAELDAEAFIAACDALTVPAGVKSSANLNNMTLPEPGELVMTPREAFFSARKLVPIKEAVGRISADTLAAYPPGIPNVIPGEVITRDLVNFLIATSLLSGGYVRGAADPDVSTMWIAEEEV